MDKLNKKGQTYDQYMQSIKEKSFPSVALTVDNVIFAIKEERFAVLLVQRGEFPFIDDWALPGGFVEKEETCEAAAIRELKEEAGLSNIELEQLYTISVPNRDPRGRTVSNCFYGVCSETFEVKASDDAKDAKWFLVDFAAKDDLYELVLKSGTLTLNAVMRIKRYPNGKIDVNASTIINQAGIAFDHALLILYAIENLSNEL